MTRKDRGAVGIVLLIGLGAVSWATGEWWLVGSAAAAWVAVSLLQPILRYYRAAPPRRQRLLIIANQAFALAGLAFYLWMIRELWTGTEPWTAWIPWVVVLAVPAALLATGFIAWHRIDDSRNGPNLSNRVRPDQTR